jgi:hypothetical protein
MFLSVATGDESMSDFVKEIKKVVEQLVWDCNIPVREHFPVNVISSRTAFVQRRYVAIEIIITEEIAEEREDNFIYVLRQRLPAFDIKLAYWPPTGSYSGSIIVHISQA